MLEQVGGSDTPEGCIRKRRGGHVGADQFGVETFLLQTLLRDDQPPQRDVGAGDRLAGTRGRSHHPARAAARVQKPPRPAI